jgi:hypothetical protein
MFNFFLSIFVGVLVSDAHVTYAITKSLIYSNPKFTAHTVPQRDLGWVDMKFWGREEQREHRNV